MSSFNSVLVTYSFASSSRVLFKSMSIRLASCVFCLILNKTGANTKVMNMFQNRYGVSSILSYQGTPHAVGGVLLLVICAATLVSTSVTTASVSVAFTQAITLASVTLA